MARFRIHRIKDAPGENFRWAAHTSGIAVVKPKDYEAGEEVEAVTAYAAWRLLASERSALRPGDVLESDGADSPGELQILKYIGFEPARWYVPDRKPELNASAQILSDSTESFSSQTGGAYSETTTQ